MALAAREALHIVRQERELDWTFVSPSAHLKPGARTGSYRMGLDDLLVGANGKARFQFQILRWRWLMSWNNLGITGCALRLGIEAGCLLAK